MAETRFSSNLGLCVRMWALPYYLRDYVRARIIIILLSQTFAIKN